MCAGIDFLRRFLGNDLLADETKDLTAESYCFDAGKNIYYTPAFRKTAGCHTAQMGINAMIDALCQAQTVR